MGLQGAGGCLHSKAATYRALRSMLASLGDPYTEFLWPSQVHLRLIPSSLDLGRPVQLLASVLAVPLARLLVNMHPQMPCNM